MNKASKMGESIFLTCFGFIFGESNQRRAIICHDEEQLIANADEIAAEIAASKASSFAVAAVIEVCFASSLSQVKYPSTTSS